MKQLNAFTPSKQGIFTPRETKSIKIYFQEINKIGTFGNSNDEKLCAIIANNGNERAKEELITRNLKFVVSVSKQYIRNGVELEDLISEGNLGILDAAKKFDSNENVKFISFAVWYILKRIRRFIELHKTNIRVPSNKLNSFKSINKKLSVLENIEFRKVMPEELLDVYDDVDLKEIQNYLDFNNYSVDSLNTEINDDGNQLIDIIIPENQILTDDYIINNEEITLLNGVLLKLEPRERDVIMMSFGINYPYEMTLDEIGERLNISRERVRTIKQKVMRKLRLKLEKFN
jgi:RNA polymerase primary sigma factor